MSIRTEWRLAAALVLCFAIGVGGIVGCGESASPSNTLEGADSQNDSIPLQLTDDVTALSPDVASELRVEEDRLIATEPVPHLLTQITRGDYLITADGDPGFWRRIDGVRRRGGKLIFQTRDAKLTEVVRNGRVDIEIKPDDSETYSVEVMVSGESSDSTRRQTLQATEDSVSSELPNSPIEKQLGTVPELQKTITKDGTEKYSLSTTGKMKLTPSFSINVKVRNQLLQDFQFDVTLGNDSKINAMYTAQVNAPTEGRSVQESESFTGVPLCPGNTLEPPGPIGCSDGEREGFSNPTAYPDVASCGGGWTTRDLQWERTKCGHNAGDDSDNPSGEGCRAADLCAPGWGICTRSEFSDSAAGTTNSGPQGACADALSQLDPPPGTSDDITKAGIVDTTGDIVVANPLKDVRPHETENDSNIYAFVERQDVSFSGGLSVDGELTDSTSTPVFAENISDGDGSLDQSLNAYALHYDPVGYDQHQAYGEIEFSNPIVGVEIDGDTSRSNHHNVPECCGDQGVQCSKKPDSTSTKCVGNYTDTLYSKESDGTRCECQATKDGTNDFVEIASGKKKARVRFRAGGSSDFIRFYTSPDGTDSGGNSGSGNCQTVIVYTISGDPYTTEVCYSLPSLGGGSGGGDTTDAIEMQDPNLSQNVAYASVGGGGASLDGGGDQYSAVTPQPTNGISGIGSNDLGGAFNDTNISIGGGGGNVSLGPGGATTNANHDYDAFFMMRHPDGCAHTEELLGCGRLKNQSGVSIGQSCSPLDQSEELTSGHIQGGVSSGKNCSKLSPSWKCKKENVSKNDGSDTKSDIIYGGNKNLGNVQPNAANIDLDPSKKLNDLVDNIQPGGGSGGNGQSGGGAQGRITVSKSAGKNGGVVCCKQAKCGMTFSLLGRDFTVYPTMKAKHNFSAEGEGKFWSEVKLRMDNSQPDSSGSSGSGGGGGDSQVEAGDENVNQQQYLEQRNSALSEGTGATKAGFKKDGLDWKGVKAPSFEAEQGLRGGAAKNMGDDQGEQQEDKGLKTSLDVEYEIGFDLVQGTAGKSLGRIQPVQTKYSVQGKINPDSDGYGCSYESKMWIEGSARTAEPSSPLSCGMSVGGDDVCLSPVPLSLYSEQVFSKKTDFVDKAYAAGVGDDQFTYDFNQNGSFESSEKNITGQQCKSEPITCKNGSHETCKQQGCVYWDHGDEEAKNPPPTDNNGYDESAKQYCGCLAKRCVLTKDQKDSSHPKTIVAILEWSPEREDSDRPSQPAYNLDLQVEEPSGTSSGSGGGGILDTTKMGGNGRQAGWILERSPGGPEPDKTYTEIALIDEVDGGKNPLSQGDEAEVTFKVEVAEKVSKDVTLDYRLKIFHGKEQVSVTDGDLPSDVGSRSVDYRYQYKVP